MRSELTFRTDIGYLTISDFMANIISRVKSRFTASRQTTLTQMAVGLERFLLHDRDWSNKDYDSNSQSVCRFNRRQLGKKSISKKIACSADLSLILNSCFLNFFNEWRSSTIDKFYSDRKIN